MSPKRAVIIGLLTLAATPALAQAPPSLLDWSTQAAEGAFTLCRGGEPDAQSVTQHGEIWGWPQFVPYLEHPDGYKREAGGESRRSDSVGDTSTYVEMTVQSGEVTSAAPVDVSYFRCNVASDQDVNAALETYFTGFYGPPTSKTDDATVWISGAEAAPDSDDKLLKAVAAGGAGAKGLRIELTHEHGIDRAKMTEFVLVSPG